eukprot:SAG31_NODE_2926_length_4901_cov_2.229696_3_plen_86_part_00
MYRYGRTQVLNLVRPYEYCKCKAVQTVLEARGYLNLVLVGRSIINLVQTSADDKLAFVYIKFSIAGPLCIKFSTAGQLTLTGGRI